MPGGLILIILWIIQRVYKGKDLIIDKIKKSLAVIQDMLDDLIMDEVDLIEEFPEQLVDAIGRLHSEIRKYIDNQEK